MTLYNSTFRNPGKPMKRSGFSQSAHKSELKAGKKRLRSRKSRGNGEEKLCRGQKCHLLIPGVPRHDRETVVPCHSNQSKHGKGMGHKADDKYTVPGCGLCHYEIDQGNRFTKEEKFAFWDAAYEKWEPVRDRLMAGLIGEENE